jgi:Ca-activated chloride channel homolog
LLRILGHRLQQLGEYRLARHVFADVLRLRPEEPQSWRDLGLVLVELKLYDQAIEQLNHVVMADWDGRFADIEVLALEDLNRAIVKAKAAGWKEFKVAPRLVQLLDVDVRIVMTWDADQTDIDLWVIEPTAEKAFYGHNRTSIGGLVSRDFTQGYGPEEYMIHHAPHGSYKISANFYGTNSATLLGPVTVQVDVYTNFGRPNEQKKSLTLRLGKAKDTVPIGEIEL